MRWILWPVGKRSKWLTVLVWVLLAIVAVPGGTKLNDISTDDPDAFLPASAESSHWAREHAAISRKFLDVSVIYRRSDARLIPSDKDRIESDRNKLLGRFTSAENPQPTAYSKDGQAALIALSVPRTSNDKAGDDYDRSQERFVGEVRQIIGSGASGLEVRTTGPAAFGADAAKTNETVNAPLLVGTMVTVVLVLLLVYRSPVLWIIPFLVIAIAQLIASGLIYLLTKHGIVMLDGLSANIIPVLVFGVGTDYALLLLARYREELHLEDDTHVAMATALRRSASAIATAGGIIVVAMLCLLASDLHSNRTLGVVGAVSIGATAVAALTLLPAMLLIFGRKVFWPVIPSYGAELRPSVIWKKLADGITQNGKTFAVLASVILAVITVVGISTLDTNLRPKDMFRIEPDSVKGEDLVAKSFTRGTTDPSLLVANTRQMDAVRQVLATDPSVSTAVRIKSSQPGPNADCMPDPNDQSKCLDLNGKSEFAVKFRDDPDSEQGRKAIAGLREKLHEVPGAQAVLGSGSAQRLDLATSAEHDRKVVVPLMLVIAFIIFALALRAITAPLMLIATVVLSFGASLGVTILVSRYVFQFPAEDPSLPLLSFVFLVAFGIDYTVFLASRVREDASSQDMRTAVVDGLTATGHVITSAGLVLAAAFAVLATMPMVFLTQLGFAVAFGVLLDTFLIRTILVPALFLWLGDKSWWPAKSPRR